MCGNRPLQVSSRLRALIHEAEDLVAFPRDPGKGSRRPSWTTFLSLSDLVPLSYQPLRHLPTISWIFLCDAHHTRQELQNDARYGIRARPVEPVPGGPPGLTKGGSGYAAPPNPSRIAARRAAERGWRLPWGDAADERRNSWMRRTCSAGIAPVAGRGFLLVAISAPLSYLNDTTGSGVAGACGGLTGRIRTAGGGPRCSSASGGPDLGCCRG